MYEVIRVKDTSDAYYISPPTISRHRLLKSAIKAMTKAGANRHSIVWHDSGRQRYLERIENDRAYFIGERGEAYAQAIR